MLQEYSMKKYLSLAITAIIITLSVMPNNLLAERQSKSFAKVKDGKIVWNISKSKFKIKLAKEWDMSINKMYIDYHKGQDDYSYFIVKGIRNKTKNNISLAVELDCKEKVKDVVNIYFKSFNGLTNIESFIFQQCLGSKNEECDFNIEENHKIEGCKKCNHSISQSASLLIGKTTLIEMIKEFFK